MILESQQITSHLWQYLGVFTERQHRKIYQLATMDEYCNCVNCTIKLLNTKVGGWRKDLFYLSLFSSRM